MQFTEGSNRPKALLGKGVLKICSKLTGEHLFRKAILTKLQSSFIETTLRHGCSNVILLHIFKILFPENTSGGLLLDTIRCIVILLLKIFRSSRPDVFLEKGILKICSKYKELY